MACGTCKKCNQGVITPTCTTICDFLVKSGCVVIDENIPCAGILEEDTLNEAIEKLCTLAQSCEELTWVTPTGAREGIDTIEYALGCNDEVHLRGQLLLDDVPINTITNLELPIPTVSRLLTINAIEDDGDLSVIIPTVFGINPVTGETYVLYNSSDTVNTPPTLTLFFDGQSYFK